MSGTDSASRHPRRDTRNKRAQLYNAYRTIVPERGGVLKCVRALTSRAPRGTKRLVLLHPGPRKSGRGLPHSGTIRSPSIGGLSTSHGDPPRSLGGYGDERDSVLERVSPLALSTRGPRCRTNRRVFSHPVPRRSPGPTAHPNSSLGRESQESPLPQAKALKARCSGRKSPNFVSKVRTASEASLENRI